MPTVKPSTTVVFESQKMFDAIEDFRFNNRFANRSQAVLYIIRAGMEALKDEYPELDLSVKLETGKKQTDVLVERQKKLI
jgi:hypothetical protein